MHILSKLSKRERLFLYIVIVFVSCVVLDKLVVLPITGKFRQLNDEISIQEKLLGKNIRNLAQKEVVLDEYKKFEGYSKPVGSDEEEMAKFLNDIEKFARQTKVYLVDIKPRPITSVDFYKKYSVEIESEAEMKGLIDFLYKVETSTGLLKIERLQFTPKRAGSSVIKGVIVITKILTP